MESKNNTYGDYRDFLLPISSLTPIPAIVANSNETRKEEALDSRLCPEKPLPYIRVLYGYIGVYCGYIGVI